MTTRLSGLIVLVFVLALTSPGIGSAQAFGAAPNADTAAQAVTPDFGPYNLGVATTLPALSYRGFVAAAIDERAQHDEDLNGDGDAIDHVLVLMEPRSGSYQNLGIAVYRFVGSPTHLLVRVLESAQGSTDLNGDGDLSDGVLHLVDVRRGTVTNLGLAGEALWLGRDHALVAASEPEQGGFDLNGDGDIVDLVFHVVDLETGSIDNLALAAAHSLPQIRGDGDAVALRVSERNQGADLNGDGDQLDTLLGAMDLAWSPGRVRLLGLAGFLDSSVRVDEPWIAFPEGPIGAVTLKVYNLRTGDLSDTGVRAVSNLLAFFDGLLVIAAQEIDRDFNGDGDLYDEVLHLYRADRDLLHNSRRTVRAFDADRHAASALTSDSTPYLITRGGRTVSLDLALGSGVPGTLLQGDHVFYFRQEGPNGDLNGDGDTDDTVLGSFEARDPVPRNLGLETFSTRLTTRGCGAVMVREADQAQDLNGDGDLDDRILHVLDGESGDAPSLGLAVVSLHSPGLYQARPPSLLFQADERSEGRDLNGDGDALDRVLHHACIP